MTLHNIHICGEELWAQRSERGTITPGYWPHIGVQVFPRVSFFQGFPSKSYTKSVSLGRKMSFWYAL